VTDISEKQFKGGRIYFDLQVSVQGQLNPLLRLEARQNIMVEGHHEESCPLCEHGKEENSWIRSQV
jgi:hypothetical protein